MKQTKISYWLKGLVIVLAIMGIVIFGVLTCYGFFLRSQQPDSRMWTFIFFTWYTAALCYLILFEFWKVCTEIGRDNSFSMENSLSFHHMGFCGIAGAAGFLVRILWFSLCGLLTPPMAGFHILELLICWIFTVLCEALSQLIQNAYEVKRENELTI
jgi:hypothetical protein